MQALMGISLLLFVATTAIVGVRMLLLARRTGERPEFLMGAGMALVGAIGYPGGIISRFGLGSVGEMNFPIWFVSTACTTLGIALIYAFTWQVFRPKATWAKVLVVVGAVFMVAGLGAMAQALKAAPPGADSALVTRGPTFIAMVGYAGSFLWTALEGFHHHRMARRRLALGLTDPIVANRFFLWGFFGLMASALTAISAVAILLGGRPSGTPVTMLPMGVLGVAAVIAMYLAFFSPAWYVDWLRNQAPKASPGRG
ncbi:MAG TPA: hypothetical protein DEP35_24980 [Deltaproteobacteria bacterium]|nr:hypothetical protein [Deltaproteobacteria bacterium]